MNTNFKILISDYDQTFYLNDDDIRKNIEAVKEFRNQGNLFVMATGRSYKDFYNKVLLYGIEYDYAIINHGATIIDAKQNILSNLAINESVIETLKKDLQLEQCISNFCCSKLESRVSFEHRNLTKINVQYNSKQKAMQINKAINSKYSSFINSYYVNKNSLEIISNATSKAQAIEVLIKKLNLSLNNIYTIGDNYSDITMIKRFHGYAMANSIDEVKKIAQKEYVSVADLINEIMAN